MFKYNGSRTSCPIFLLHHWVTKLRRGFHFHTRALAIYTGFVIDQGSLTIISTSDKFKNVRVYVCVRARAK